MDRGFQQRHLHAHLTEIETIDFPFFQPGYPINVIHPLNIKYVNNDSMESNFYHLLTDRLLGIWARTIDRGATTFFEKRRGQRLFRKK